MSTRVVVPLVSTNALDVTVGRWHARPGESVARGQVLLDVSTDKAAFDVESPVDGVLLAVYAPPRSVVPIGYVVALVGEAGETDPTVEADNEALVAAHRKALSAETGAPPRGTSGAAGPMPERRPADASSAGTTTADADSVRATPKAKRLAREHGVDLVRVQAETGAAIVTEAVLAPYLQ